MAKLALLRQCDAVLACNAVTGCTREYWMAIRNKAQPSFADIFSSMFR